MQKIIRRTLLAERQVARRALKKKQLHDRQRATATRQQSFYIIAEEARMAKEARKNLREDYELGPLKPKRDVGTNKDKYGAVSSNMLKGPVLLGNELEKNLAYVGEGLMYKKGKAHGRHTIVEGDRVVILAGKDKGKIGTIQAMDYQRCECTIEGLNMIDVIVPGHLRDDYDNNAIRTVEKGVPFKDIKLVWPLTSKEGVTKDVIVNKIESRGHHLDEASGEWRHRRVIAGLEIELPFPETPTPEYRDTPADTLRLEVDTKTFIPSLLRPPMPHSVIDELRNKYSKFRTRHEPEYIAAKEAQEALKVAKTKSVAEMRTPIQLVNRREKQARKKLGKPILTAEMLERIGKVIAKHRPDVVGLEVNKEVA